MCSGDRRGLKTLLARSRYEPDMAQRKALTERQVQLLRWIGNRDQRPEPVGISAEVGAGRGQLAEGLDSLV